jgi:soluble lytic murein transglycosylase-like protein
MSLSGDLLSVRRRMDELDGGGAPDAPSALLSASASQPSSPPASTAALFRNIIARSAAQARVDPALIEAVISKESAFDPHATSSAGAQGLMQLMPQTAMALGASDPYDPAQNVRAGARYLRSLLDRFGADVPLALAAYNAGPGAVERYDAIPPYAETRAYVEEVLSTYDALRLRAR